MVEQYHDMLDAKIAKLRAVTEEALSVAVVLEKKVEAGQLTREEAIKQFRDTVRPLRFDNGTGYIFSYDMNGLTMILGPTPEREGTNLFEVRDPEGFPFVQEEIRVAKAGGGTLSYHYPKPGSKVAQPKISYVAPFAPWNLYAGAGLYTDDLRAALWSKFLRFGGIILALFAASSVIAWLVARSITRPLSRLQQRMIDLTKGDLGAEIPGHDRGDEIGEMARAVEVFRQNAIERAELRAEQERQAKRASEERRLARLELADGFERSAGAIVAAVRRVRARGQKVAHAHLVHLHPFPANLGDVLARYRLVLVPEMNLGQLSRLVRAEYLVDARPLSKVQGVPFRAREIEAAIEAELGGCR
jgi:methyl-accepting chemotaxis protein